MEGILSHFNAKTLKNKQITSDITQLLKETNKVFCLDGDLHNRSLDYLENTILKNYEYYKNEHKPLKKKKHVPHVLIWRARAIFGQGIAGNTRGVGNNALLSCLRSFLAHKWPFPFKPEFR